MSAVDDYLGPRGSIARRLRGYEERPEQLEMARAVETALAGGRHLLAEAGTGVGKSFAYLLPAVVRATAGHGDGPIVVSTRTIALQEQLERKDLPFLQSVLPLEWTAVTAVGRNNYVCLRRMNLARRERGVLFPDAEREAQLQRVIEWSLDTREGTRMDLPHPVDDAVWDEVKAEHGNCLYKACPHYEPCPYQRSRRRLDTAQVLVVNHALYMSDVALRAAGASYLPDHRVVIFDEAHHLERVATESLGLRLSLGTVRWHLRRLRPRRCQGRSLLDAHGTALARVLHATLGDAAEAFFAALRDRIDASCSDPLALGDERLEDPLSGPAQDLAGELLGSSVAVEDVDLRMELTARARGLNALAAVAQRLCAPEEPGTVRWIEAGRRSPTLIAAPLDVSATLREHVFTEPRTCVLTSATLGPTGDPGFAWLRGQLGIDAADTLRVGSPFDYRHNVRVELCEAMPDPGRDPDGYLLACEREVATRVVDNGGRALVLCTSWRFVKAIADALIEPLRDAGIPLLVQGEAPLRQLLDHKRGDPTSVLVGTESLWEGIDVPGDALTLLIVTRFPFAQPDHPLTRARCDAITARGGDAFYEHSLPAAVLRFRQGFGRLVRRQGDRGTVVVLDPRARTRRYGRRFLEALPDGTLDEP